MPEMDKNDQIAAGKEAGGTTAGEKSMSLEDAVKLVQKLTVDNVALAAKASAVDNLTKTVEDMKRAQEESERRALEKKGEYEKLYNDTKGKLEAAESAMKLKDRRHELIQVIHAQEKPKYPWGAMIDVIGYVDVETGYKLSADDLIKATIDRLDKWGLQPKNETMALGGGARSEARPQNTAIQQEYIDAVKRGSQGDLKARKKVGELAAKMKAQGIEIPRVSL